MKKLLALAALLYSVSFGATLTPIQLLSPTGSTAGQSILSTGSSSAPAYTSIPTTVAGRTGAVVLSNTDISGLGTAATVNTGTSGATIPLLNGINVWGAANTFSTPIGVPSGGTGVATVTGLVLGNGTSAMSAFAGTSCTNQFPRSLNTSGTATCASVALATDVTGTIQAAQFPALTGDVTTSAGALASTLATVNSNVGSFGSATQSLSTTVNGKGLVTAMSAQTITPAFSSITGLPATASGHGITSIDGIPTGATTPSTGKFTTFGSNGITDNATVANSVTLKNNTNSAQMSLGIAQSSYDNTLLGVLEVGGAGTGIGGINPNLYVTGNARFNGSWKYGSTNGAVKIEGTSDGVLKLSTSGVGSSGNAITWVDGLSLSATGTATFAASLIPASNASGSLGSGSFGYARLYIDYTNTATVGNVTINKASGRVNLAAAGVSLTVTDSLVTAASHCFLNADSAPGNVVAVQFYAIPAAGSFTVNAVPAVTNQTAVDFFCVSAD